MLARTLCWTVIALGFSTGLLRAEEATVFTDYTAATAEAAKTRKLLAVSLGCEVPWESFRQEWRQHFVFCRLPAEATCQQGDEELPLAKAPYLADLEGRGVFILDYRHKDYWHRVVSLLPRRHVTRAKVLHLLWLPPGTLNQRTMVWALRVHPARPASVYGRPVRQLFEHARANNCRQCAYGVQGHHTPLSYLGGKAQEIAASSWPWEHNIVDGALSCVDAWTHSGGHWGAACTPGREFGYDLRRGYEALQGGFVWYATGVFRRR